MAAVVIAGCPVCQARYRLDGARIPGGGVTLRCNSCRSVFRVRGKSAPVPSRSSVAETVTRVLVAHENPALRTAVRQALACEPFQVLEAADGAGAYAAILEHRPRVAILDAALPGMFAFEICEAVKGSPATADIKIILIASIYDKAKYKRAPESLHGADDYLEKHHIPDELPARVHRLLAGTAPHCGGTHPEGGRGGADSGEQRHAGRDSGEQPCGEARNGEYDGAGLPGGDDPALAGEHLKARRLARLIVSDIALYNRDLVREGVRNGTFFELLAEDVAEGRALYENRVSGDVRAGTSYLDEAFAEFIGTIRKELGL
ncbi:MULTISPECIES: response regulator [Geobacter]|uniref:Chemotaxis protein CheY n=2 Tax=Geobacter TaxID=28231 RepID=A0A0C1TLR6_9BACT|nr:MULTISPECIES: response regulator [Geobacter]KIE41839.1 chemotaxis protein CheY [Geobacter soli]MBE2887976.1 zinc-ribbon domain-containing protein [Geobacter anodireducens]